MTEMEKATKLAQAAIVTDLLAHTLARVDRLGEQRAALVDELRSAGVPLAAIERATGASRAALTRRSVAVEGG